MTQKINWLWVMVLTKLGIKRDKNKIVFPFFVHFMRNYRNSNKYGLNEHQREFGKKNLVMKYHALRIKFTGFKILLTFSLHLFLLGNIQQMALLFFKIFSLIPFWHSVRIASTTISFDTNRLPHILCLMFGTKRSH